MSGFWYDQISHAYKNSGHCPIHTLSYKTITVHYKTLIHTLLKHLALVSLISSSGMFIFNPNMLELVITMLSSLQLIAKEKKISTLVTC